NDGQGVLTFAQTSAVTPTQEPGTPGGEAGLAGTQWTLISFGDVGAEMPVVEGSTVTLEFEEGSQAGGNAGCNSFGGTYQVENGTLSFDQIVSTLMACVDENVMQ